MNETDRSIRWFFIALALVFANVPIVKCQVAIARTVTDLDHGWQFRQVSGEDVQKRSHWMPATVPGDVHLDLLANKLIPEPFYRDNETRLQWIENAAWEYQVVFDVTPQQLAHQNLDLLFDGLDAACQIYVDGKLLLTPDNMHRSWRTAVKSQVHVGENQLRIVFPSPIVAAHEVASHDVWQARTGTEDNAYIRKANYEYGWDWGPRFVTSGVWRPVHLEAWDQVRISDLHIRQRAVSNTLANLDAQVQLEATTAGAAEISITYAGDQRPVTLKRTVHLETGQNLIDLPFEISNPRLWYPAGYGSQDLYQFTAQVEKSGRVEDERQQKTGLRSVVLRRDLDQWGRSFEFVVNGIPVFAKGADVIPFDSFPSRVKTADLRYILQSAHDANMNMVRVWGGGYYETDEFYAICDELGLMVWQDFMFGNRWQPGTYSFKQEIEKEAAEQVVRLRDHPSIVLWCGNNETESLFDRRAAGETHPAEVRFQMWQDYLTEFSGRLPAVVARLDPETPYWPSSPSADYEATSPAFVSGDAHDWSVWHKRIPFSAYEQHKFRFVSEYGFQSFPEMRTIEEFTLPEDRTSIFTPVMLAHQKSGIGNSVIQDYLLKDYSQPKDFAAFLYVSQVLQAEGVKIGTEHWRRNRPETMGTLFWQLNDCWPVASWSSIDSEGRWKALQYYARRFYAPVLVSPHVEDESVKIYVVSDKTTNTAEKLTVRLMNFSGDVLLQETKPIQVAPLASQVYAQWTMTKLKASGANDLSKVFIVAELESNGTSISRNVMYLAPTKQVQLPAARLQIKLAATSAAQYELSVTAPSLARDVYIDFGKLDVTLSDNYFDLLPGETRTISVSATGTGITLDQLRNGLKVISLADAFDNKTTAQSASVKP